MIKPASHFKIGLFVLVALLAFIASAAGLGAKRLRRETVEYHTYFNESVQGLDVGAPVKFRGVNIGVVSAIEIAPDHRHVDVVAKLDVQDIRRMGLTEKRTPEARQDRFIVPSDLRAQLGSQGITGVKFLLIDYFDEEQNPPLELPFAPDPNYIPAATSLFKNLEDSLVSALDKLPDLAERILTVVSRVDSILSELQAKDVAGNIGVAAREAGEALADLHRLVEHTDRQDLPGKAAVALGQLEKAIGKMNEVLGRLGGDDGLVASARRATDAFGTAGKNAVGTTKKLDETLRGVLEAAEAIRELADELDRDPDMLLKGRARKKSKKP